MDKLPQIRSKEHNIIFVVDSIASGSMWVDMEKLNVDALITAPQKGWSGFAGVGVVCLSKKACDYLASDKSPKPSSFTTILFIHPYYFIK